MNLLRKKDFIILGVLVVIIIISIILGIREKPEERVKEEEIERLVGEEEVVLPDDVVELPDVDEMVEAPVEFCLTVITENQLREITGHKGDFIFTDRADDFPELGKIETCEIQASDIKLMGGIGLFSPEITYEVVKEKITVMFAELEKEMLKMMPDMEVTMLIKEIDDVGKQAFAVTVGDIFHQITFLKSDTNRVVGVAIEGVDYDILVKIAKQVEMNIE